MPDLYRLVTIAAQARADACEAARLAQYLHRRGHSAHVVSVALNYAGITADAYRARYDALKAALKNA